MAFESAFVFLFVLIIIGVVDVKDWRGFPAAGAHTLGLRGGIRVQRLQLSLLLLLLLLLSVVVPLLWFVLVCVSVG